jgi:hypothetical protein
MFGALYFTINRRNICLAMSATALTSTKWRIFNPKNQQNFAFFCLVPSPRSPTHTGLICVKTPEPNRKERKKEHLFLNHSK